MYIHYIQTLRVSCARASQVLELRISVWFSRGSLMEQKFNQPRTRGSGSAQFSLLCYFTYLILPYLACLFHMYITFLLTCSTVCRFLACLPASLCGATVVAVVVEALGLASGWLCCRSSGFQSVDVESGGLIRKVVGGHGISLVFTGASSLNEVRDYRIMSLVCVSTCIRRSPHAYVHVLTVVDSISCITARHSRCIYIYMYGYVRFLRARTGIAEFPCFSVPLFLPFRVMRLRVSGVYVFVCLPAWD